MSTDLRETVLGCAAHLAEHNGSETVVLDFEALSTWTDYFIITTATSSTHLKALARHAEEYLSAVGLSALRRPRLADDEQWCLLDFGDFVVHVMSTEARAFYELEKLWYQAVVLPVEAPGAPAKEPSGV
ncbi:MAG: ribosome silencing factor [Spirochaetales bacterium]|nr:ribosome silencing factor [Spirochaetales bacterium]